MRTRRWLPLVFVLALLAGACERAPATPEAAPSPTRAVVRIGTGPARESQLLANILANLLVAAEVPAEVVDFEDARQARQALEFGEIVLLPGYTGAAWLEVLGRADPPSDLATSYRRVRQLDSSNGVSWLAPTIDPSGSIDTPPANATFAFVVRGVPALTAQIGTVSQLAAALAADPAAALCVDPEFVERGDGLRAVLRTYAIRFDVSVVGVGPDEIGPSLVAGECLAGLTTATDGVAWRAGLVPLRDDLGVFPAFVVTAVVRSGFRADQPDAVRAIEPLLLHLTTRRLGTWNAQVISGIAIEDVALGASEELRALASPPAAEREPDPDVSASPVAAPTTPGR